MSYEPTNWKTGDVVTSAKLNKLEQGVADGVLIVHETNIETNMTLDKTWQEIYDALAAGKTVTCFRTNNDGEVIQYRIFAAFKHEYEGEPSSYEIRMFAFDINERVTVSTTDKDGYPQEQVE